MRSSAIVGPRHFNHTQRLVRAESDQVRQATIDVLQAQLELCASLQIDTMSAFDEVENELESAVFKAKKQGLNNMLSSVLSVCGNQKTKHRLLGIVG